MESMDKLSAISYIANSNPVCANCLRGNLEQIRMAAGLYQLVKDIVSENQATFSQEYLDGKIAQISLF